MTSSCLAGVDVRSLMMIAQSLDGRFSGAASGVRTDILTKIKKYKTNPNNPSKSSSFVFISPSI
jgi:hypothetical protein